MEFARRSGAVFAQRYDRIVRCLGWAHNTTIYGGLEPQLMFGKLPIMTPSYESANIKSLHYAGTLQHGRDFKRSGGGVLHGFRYSSMALARILLSEVKGDPWPHIRIFNDVHNWDGKEIGHGVAADAGYKPPQDAPLHGLPALVSHMFRRWVNLLFNGAMAAFKSLNLHMLCGAMQDQLCFGAISDGF